MAQTRETYHFIHNVFGHFFKDMLDYFSTTLYPRFEYRVVGTYDKAVEYLAKRAQYERETDQPLLPALVLNPSGEFSPADGNAGGRQLWRFPNLAPSMIKRLFDPIYQDDHVIMHAGFIRIKGEFELIMLLNSFYEYCDLRLMMINYFGGMDRIIYPQFFSSFIILPDSFLSYEYSNEYTGTTYNIDWSTANASNQLVRSTAKNEVVLPLNIKPQISLVSMSDASNRYGGPDKIAEWRLTSTVNYEIEIPNYLILESDYLAEKINLELRYGSAFSAYNDYQPPVNRQIYNYHWDWGLDATANTDITYLDPSDATCEIDNIGDYVFKTRYFHEVTTADAAQQTYLDIPLPETITDRLMLIVNSRHGALDYGDHFLIVNNGNTLRIKMANVSLSEGWFLELYVYEDINSSSSSSTSVSSSSSSSSLSSSSSSLSSSSSAASSIALETTINNALDDGMIYSAGNIFVTTYPPNSSYQLLGNTNGTGWSFVVFHDVDVPNGATITDAYITFKSRTVSGSDANTQNMYFEQADNPIAPISTPDLTGRTRGGVVNWVLGTWSTDSFYQTPNISSIIQPIFNRGGWVSGNNIHFISITVGGNYNFRVAYAANLAFETKLTIVWNL